MRSLSNSRSWTNLIKPNADANRESEQPKRTSFRTYSIRPLGNTTRRDCHSDACLFGGWRAICQCTGWCGRWRNSANSANSANRSILLCLAAILNKHFHAQWNGTDASAATGQGRSMARGNTKAVVHPCSTAGIAYQEMVQILTHARSAGG